MKKCTLNCEKLKIPFLVSNLGILGPPGGLKGRISTNPFVFLFAHPITTYKPKMMMIHKEMHPELRKNWKFNFLVPNLGILGSPGGQKRRISQNPFVFLFAHPLTTYKPKMVMIHEEMHPELRKNWKFHFWYQIFGIFGGFWGIKGSKKANFAKSYFRPDGGHISILRTKFRVSSP